MQRSALIGTIVAALFLGSANAPAGPGGRRHVAYNRGDYVPAIRLLAEAGNPKAQTQIGTMYRKGEGA